MRNKRRRTNRNRNNKKPDNRIIVLLGVLSKVKSGNGFVSGKESDIFIPLAEMNGAMHGDEVEIDYHTRSQRYKGAFGSIRKIISQKKGDIFGIYRYGLERDYVELIGECRYDDPLVIDEVSVVAEHGDLVRVELSRRPTKTCYGHCKVVEIVKGDSKLNARVRIIIDSYGVPKTFNSKSLNEAGHIKDEITDSDIETRRDLRGEMIFTIDGPDAKDFDDAICIKMLKNGNYLLGVHIADVSHFVKNGSALDKQAYARGTSIYVPDFVVPMLPEKLSNGVCSLVQGEDRLTLSIDMEINAKGQVVSSQIYEAIINSKARLVYDDVSDLLEGRKKKRRIKGLTEALFLANDLYEVLANARKKRGSIEFELPELIVELDEKKEAKSIYEKHRRVANKLIEEFMLLANETVAKRYSELNLPFIYRVHGRPEPEDIRDLAEFLGELDYKAKFDFDRIEPLDLAKVLADFEGRPELPIISKKLLRFMKKAEYSSRDEGHFGLALRHYTHFTSPIRRYPDLFIHRAIKQKLHSTSHVSNENTNVKTNKKMSKRKMFEAAQGVARHSSQTEQTAVLIEREVASYYQASFLLDKIGQNYTGTVASILYNKTYVRIDEFGIEGALGVGARPAKGLSLGDKVNIRIANIDEGTNEIRLEEVDR